MYSVRRGTPMSSSDSMTWATQNHLTPSPEPFSYPLESQKVAAYATPPLSPADSRESFGYSFSGKNPVGMDDPRSRPFDQRSYQTAHYGNLQGKQQFVRSFDRSRVQSVRSSPQTIAMSQRPYPFNEAQQQQYVPAPQVQDSPIQSNTNYPHINQRQDTYPAYSSNLMYSVTTPNDMHSDYDPVQQYQSRQPTAGGGLSDHLGISQQFYNDVREPSSAATQSLPLYSSTQYQPQQLSSFHQPTPAIPSILSSQPTVDTSYYPIGLDDYSLFNMPAIPEQSTSSGSGHIDSNFETFNQSLKKVYVQMRDGKLVEAGYDLLAFSTQWFIKSLPQFGLNNDDKLKQALRLQLWKDFNHCWLAVLQKQKDLSSGEETFSGPHSLMSATQLKKMGDELVDMCNQIEGNGLVDYEMGIWEEEIISVLLDCMQILKGEKAGSSSSTRTQSLSNARRTS